MAYQRVVSLAIVVALLLGGSAWGGLVRDDTADTLYTNLALDTKFDAAGLLAGWLGGVLIAPDWVLTAGHVAAAMTPGSSTFQVGGNTYIVDMAIIDSGYNAGSLQNDIALLHLSTSVGGVTPAQIYTGSQELLNGNKLSTVVGYGLTGTGLTGDTGPGGTRRAGQNNIDTFATLGTNGSITPNTNPSAKVILWDFDSPTDPSKSSFGSSSPVTLEYHLAAGDSGSPLFIDVGSTTYVAGIASFVAETSVSGNASDLYGAWSGFTRVSQYTSFINGTMGGQWTSPVQSILNAGMVTVPASSTLTVDGSITGTGNTVVNGYLAAQYIRQNELSIGPGGKVTITGNGTSVVNSLSIAGFANAPLSSVTSASEPAIPSGDTGSVVVSGGGISMVPEPATWLMLLAASLAGLVAWRKRRRV